MKRILALLLFISYFQLTAQSVYVYDRKIYVDGQEYRINAICYARGEGNGENSGYSFNDDIPLLVDANITWRNVDDTYYVTVYGKNLTDETYRVGSNSVAGLWNFTLYGEPMEYGIEAGYRW